MVAPLCLLSTLILVINLSCLPSYWWVTNGDPFLLHSPLKKTGLDSKPWKKNVLNMAFFFGNFLHIKLIGTYLDVSPDVLKVANLLQFDEVLFGLQVQMSNGRWYKLGSSCGVGRVYLCIFVFLYLYVYFQVLSNERWYKLGSSLWSPEGGLVYFCICMCIFKSCPMGGGTS